MPKVIDKHDIERRKPIKRLLCCCCGGAYHGRQWSNQDTGHGLGDCCAEYVRLRFHEDDSKTFEQTYGIDGIHYNTQESEK